MDRQAIAGGLRSVRGPVSAHDLYRRLRALAYARLAARELPEVGRGARIEPSVRLAGTLNIRVGAGAIISDLARLSTVEGGEIAVGRGVWIGPNNVLTSSTRLVIEDEVMLAGNCFLSTHRHRFDGEGPIRRQGITDRGDIVVGTGAWLAANVLVMPGVRIGRGAVVGGNSVVRDDVPDFHVAAGAPARILGPISDADDNPVLGPPSPTAVVPHPRTSQQAPSAAPDR